MENDNSEKLSFNLGSGFHKKSTRPFCRCLYEIENKLPRTKHCFVACSDQHQILAERAEQKKNEQSGDAK